MNLQKYHFISGLPRAGSTLLSSILNQNPRFHASISDPMRSFCHSIYRETDMGTGFRTQVSDDMKLHLMRTLFRAYYQERDAEVCFNTSRAWTSDTALLKQLFPDFRMIVCVRDVLWVLDSFERLHNKNPHVLKPLYDNQDLETVYDRSNFLMGVGGPGYVSGPLNSLKQSLACAERDQICFVDYDELAQHPHDVMEYIYKFLEEPYFEHDFDNVEASYDEYDAESKMIGLHEIRKKVQYEPRRMILPEDVQSFFGPASSWKNMDKSQLKWIGR